MPTRMKIAADDHVAEGADVTHQPAGRGGDRADDGDGDQDAGGEQGGQDSGAPAGGLSPRPWMKPTIRGMLARWQGLSTMLSTPQARAAARATWGAPSTAGGQGFEEAAHAQAPLSGNRDTQLTPLGQDVLAPNRIPRAGTAPFRRRRRRSGSE